MFPAPFPSLGSIYQDRNGIYFKCPNTVLLMESLSSGGSLSNEQGRQRTLIASLQVSLQGIDCGLQSVKGIQIID